MHHALSPANHLIAHHVDKLKNSQSHTSDRISYNYGRELVNCCNFVIVMYRATRFF